MLSSPATNADVYTSFEGLAKLRTMAKNESPEALDGVAEQFEAMFLQMLFKSVRDSSFGDPLFGGQQMDFYKDMYDKQLSLELAKSGGIGIRDMLVQQLGGKKEKEGQSTVEGDLTDALTMARLRGSFPVPERSAMSAIMPKAKAEMSQDEIEQIDTPQEFVEKLWPHAQEAAKDLGVKPELLLAQAALETGWGKSVIRRPDGRSSYNLFNIKADSRWDGEAASVSTLEFRNGAMQRERAAFRAYDSYSDSFADYVGFLRSNPRYADALNQTHSEIAFTKALQQAGYATDPDYATKINRVLTSSAMAEAVEGLKNLAG